MKRMSVSSNRPHQSEKPLYAHHPVGHAFESRLATTLITQSLNLSTNPLRHGALLHPLLPSQSHKDSRKLTGTV